MGIVDEDVQRVHDDADIVDVIGRYVALKKTGRQFMALCPFHGEKTPSLSVSPDKGVFYCFGCQRHGDAISFVREIEGLDFVGAVEHLADRAGITLRYSEADGGRSRRRRNDILRALDMAAAFYHERLMNGSDAGPARAYLRDRGYDRETVERFRLGWAPDEWDGLHRHLSSRSGAPASAVLDAAGLVFTNQRQRRQDSFRARVMFPISDVNDAVVGFGGRMLPGGRPPKYKNSADGEVYNKSRILYGLNWAHGDIVAHDEVVVCEGYTDVIGFRRSGISRAVATCGTALTDEHVKLLTRFAHRIVLAFDADSAGRAAADRFHEWERSYDVQVYVAGLPDGTDPGELAQQDPDRLALAVEDAVPFLAYRVDRALAGGRLHEAEGRARAAEEALALVAAHPDPLVRDQYVVAVAERLGFEPGQLRHLASEPGRRGEHAGPAAHGDRPRAVRRRRARAAAAAPRRPPPVRRRRPRRIRPSSPIPSTPPPSPRSGRRPTWHRGDRVVGGGGGGAARTPRRGGRRRPRPQGSDERRRQGRDPRRPSPGAPAPRRAVRADARGGQSPPAHDRLGRPTRVRSQPGGWRRARSGGGGVGRVAPDTAAQEGGAGQ